MHHRPRPSPSRGASIALPMAALVGLLIWHVTSKNGNQFTSPTAPPDLNLEEPTPTSLEDARRSRQEAQDRYRYICVTDTHGRRTETVTHLTADCYRSGAGADKLGCTAFVGKKLEKAYDPGTFSLGRCP